MDSNFTSRPHKIGSEETDHQHAVAWNITPAHQRRKTVQMAIEADYCHHLVRFAENFQQRLQLLAEAEAAAARPERSAS